MVGPISVPSPLSLPQLRSITSGTGVGEGIFVAILSMSHAPSRDVTSFSSTQQQSGQHTGHFMHVTWQQPHSQPMTRQHFNFFPPFFALPLLSQHEDGRRQHEPSPSPLS